MNNIYGKTPRCTYNAAGERIMKSYGTMEGVYINGAPQGITFHETPKVKHTGRHPSSPLKREEKQILPDFLLKPELKKDEQPYISPDFPPEVRTGNK